MRKHLITIIAFCAACLVLGAQGQPQQSGTSSSSSSNPAYDKNKSSGYHSGLDASKHLDATGRMGQQELRASKLTGAEVKSSSGEQLGTINDVIINPNSGRIDFAVLALNPSASSGTGTTPSATTTPSTTSSSDRSSSISSTTASTGEKLVAVPWSLLRSSGATGYGATSGTSTSSSVTSSSSSTTSGLGISTSALGSISFVFTGDMTKLQAAPSFDQSNWPDINTYEWRHSVYSYFGMSPGSATGGSFSPGGSDTGRSSSGTSTPSSSGSTPPDSSSSSSDKPQ